MKILAMIALLLIALGVLVGVAGTNSALAATSYELWVPNQADDQINIYSSDGFQVLQTVDVNGGTFAKGAKPHLVAFSPSGKFAFVTNVGAKANTNNVTVVRAADRKIVAQIPTAASAHATAFSPDGKRAWIYNTAANEITEVLNDEAAEKFTVSRTIKLGIRPVLGTFTPDGAYNIVTLGGNADFLGAIATVDVASGKVVEQIETGREAVGVLLSHDKSRLYTSVGYHAKNPSDMNERLYVFNPNTRALTQNIKLDGIKDSHLLAETPDGRELWLANRQSNTVTILDAATGALKQTVTVGDRPDAIAFSPDGKYAFWTLRGQPQTGDPFALKGNSPGVEVYDAAARTYVAFIPMPSGDPHGIAVYAPQSVSAAPQAAPAAPQPAPAVLPTAGTSDSSQIAFLLILSGVCLLALGVVLRRGAMK